MSELNKKRERNANFSREETEKLVSLIEAFINIIENKKSDAETWQEKEKAWKVIEEEFNNSGTGVFRNAKHLKLKYEALKRDIRKKSSIMRSEHYDNGGIVNEAPPLTPIEKKVKQMILMSIEGGNSNDYDQPDVTASEKPVDIICLAEGTVQPNLIGHHINDTGTDYYLNNLIHKIPEKPQQQIYLEHADDTVHPALCKPKEKGSFDKLVKRKLEIVKLKKKLIEEELQEKILKKQMMNVELQHKQEMYKLEKEEMLLKLEILKYELESKKKL